MEAGEGIFFVRSSRTPGAESSFVIEVPGVDVRPQGWSFSYIYLSP